VSETRTAVFPGTFDPFTNGHLDLTRRAARLFDRVVVAVAHSPAKGALFPVAERVEMIRATTRSLRRVEVVDFSDLVVDCARRVGAQVMIRGLRAVSDFEFEFQMALMNRRLSRALEVAFLMPSQQYTYLNSTLVKEVARLGGSVRGLVPRLVEEALRARLGLRPARGKVKAAAPSDGAGTARVARTGRDGAARGRAAAAGRRPRAARAARRS
jgi:pantetheine-phosphate adenylyltransferase